MFVGVTGAHGVGKSTFSARLQGQLSTVLVQKVGLLEGLGGSIRAKGIPVGSAADAQSVAAIYAAHLERERQVNDSQITVLDRCAVDALAYVRALKCNTPGEIWLYEEVSRRMSEKLAIVFHLVLEDPFLCKGAEHETVQLRSSVAYHIPAIISQLGIQSIQLNAADSRALQVAEDAVLSTLRS